MLCYGVTKEEDMATRYTPEQLETMKEAAPEMYEALEDVIACIGSAAEIGTRKWLKCEERVRAALAKARGGA